MTNPTPHGQVPEALRLAEQYDHGDPAAHGNAWKAAVCTELRRLAELEAQIEALSGVQALSAAPAVPHMSAAEVNNLPARARAYIHQLASLCDPAGLVRENAQLLDTNNALQKMYRRAADACAEVFGCFAAAESEGLKDALLDTTDERLKDLVERRLMYAMHAVRDIAASPTPPAEQQAQPGAVYAELHEPDATTVGLGAVWNRHSMRDFADRTHALRMEQAAPKAAPGVGNSGFDHQTAADFLSGKTVSDEAVRKFVAASRWAHDERAALSATLLAMHGVLTSREAEIALLKKALLEAEAAPQQEAQEPAFWMNEKGHTWSHSDWKQFPKHRAKYPIPLYPHFPAPQPAPACHHRPPCAECASLTAQGGK